MAIPSLNSGNFCCLAIPTRVSSDFTVQIGTEVYATTEVPFDIDDWWQNQLGEIDIREIKECTLFLLARSSDPSMDVPFLNSHLHSHYNSLLLQGVGYSRRGVILGGENSLVWHKQASDLIALWGNTIDLHSAPKWTIFQLPLIRHEISQE